MKVLGLIFIINFKLYASIGLTNNSITLDIVECNSTKNLDQLEIVPNSFEFERMIDDESYYHSNLCFYSASSCDSSTFSVGVSEKSLWMRTFVFRSKNFKKGKKIVYSVSRHNISLEDFTKELSSEKVIVDEALNIDFDGVVAIGDASISEVLEKWIKKYNDPKIAVKTYPVFKIVIKNGNYSQDFLILSKECSKNRFTFDSVKVADKEILPDLKNKTDVVSSKSQKKKVELNDPYKNEGDFYIPRAEIKTFDTTKKDVKLVRYCKSHEDLSNYVVYDKPFKMNIENFRFRYEDNKKLWNLCLDVTSLSEDKYLTPKDLYLNGINNLSLYFNIPDALTGYHKRSIKFTANEVKCLKCDNSKCSKEIVNQISFGEAKDSFLIYYNSSNSLIKIPDKGLKKYKYLRDVYLDISFDLLRDAYSYKIKLFDEYKRSELCE